MKVTLLLTLALPLLAADPKPAEKPKPPAIPPEHLVEYYRADGVFARMQQAMKEAQDDMQRAVAAIQKDCGEKFNPMPEGKTISCQEKPEAKVPPPPLK